MRLVTGFILALSVLVPLNAFAEEISEDSTYLLSSNAALFSNGMFDDCKWILEDNTLTISGGPVLEGLSGNPFEMAEEDFPQWWTDVQSALDESGTTLENLVIEEGIVEIGDAPFPVDTFETLTLPDSLTKIGDYSFGYFLNVSGELVLSENVTEIGDAAFVCCPYNNITILNPDAVIGECAIGCSLDHRPESGAVLMQNFTITGYAGSTAQHYADEYGIPFIVLSPPYEESASGTCGDGVTWTVADGTLTIGGTGNMDDYDNYDKEFVGMQPVETLARPWESYSDTITSIVIKDGVTGIGNFAFSDLYYVEHVDWSDSLEHIGDYAFLSVNDADTVTTFEALPANLKSIGDGAFLGQDDFSWKLELPQGLESVGMAAFAGAEGQTRYSVTIPESLVTIGAYAFGGTPAPYEGDGWEWLEDLSNAIFYKEQPVSNFFTGMDGFIVYGNTGTAAQTYAETYGFTFEALDAESTTTETSETESTETTSTTTSSSAATAPESTSAATTTTSTTSASSTTVTNSTTATKNNTTSSPKTSDAGILSLALTGVTALLSSLICRKRR